jgi:hypothetical protein
MMSASESRMGKAWHKITLMIHASLGALMTLRYSTATTQRIA